MSEPTAIEPGAGAAQAQAAPAWRIREACGDDIAAVAAAVEQLLVELGGRRPSTPELEAEVEVLLEDPLVGILLVAESGAEIVGVLSASRQRALHVPGRYLTIQDLWVHPSWRSRRIGAALIEAIADLARAQGVTRIEVGLPRESFEGIAATEAFYLNNKFELLGARMRRLLA